MDTEIQKLFIGHTVYIFQLSTVCYAVITKIGPIIVTKYGDKFFVDTYYTTNNTSNCSLSKLTANIEEIKKYLGEIL